MARSAFEHADALDADVALVDDHGIRLGSDRFAEGRHPGQLGLGHLGEQRDVTEVVHGPLDRFVLRRQAAFPPG